MDSRGLAGLLSSLTSTIISLLLILPHTPYTNSFSHLLSDSHSATASISLLPRKRKRTHHPNSPHSPKLDPNSPQLGRVNSFSDQTHFPNVVKLGHLPFKMDGLCGLGRVDSFKHCFNMTRVTFEWLAGLLEPLLDCRDPGGVPLGLSAETRLSIGLFRLGTGADFVEISNRFEVEEKVARFCVKQLCRVLCTNFRFWVGFQNPNETLKYSEIPNCCGVISTTTFQLSKNDKTGKKCIKSQIVVDSSCRILSVFAGFCGDKSDFTVLKRSALYKDIEERRVLDGSCMYIRNVAVPQFLIGNGDYPLLPWLITPFVDPLRGSCEDEFNSELKVIRGSSIRVIASLKHWGILSKPIEGGIKDAVAYIGACSILHNGLLMREDYSALSDEAENFEGVKGRSLGESMIGDEGEVVRMTLVMRDKGDS